MKRSLIIVVAVILSMQCMAQTCCSGGVPLANNIGGLPISSKNTWQLSFSADLNVLQTLKEGAHTLNDDSRQRKTLSLLFKTSYSFTDRFFIEGLLSWVQQERAIDQAGGFNDFDQTQGERCHDPKGNFKSKTGDTLLWVEDSFSLMDNLTVHWALRQ